MTPLRRAGWKAVLIASLAIVCAAAVDAQWRGRYREGSFAARYAPERRLDEILELAEHRMMRDRQKEDSGRPAPARAEGSSA